MQACLTLDLEPDFGGWIPETYSAWDGTKVQGLLKTLESYEVPLTVFVVGQSLGVQPAVVDLFRAYPAEFHLHSHSHDLQNPDSKDEIARGITAFERAFGERPLGYRAPQGRITPQGFKNLEAEQFLFDSSIFPSFWPAPRYLRFAPAPFWPEGVKLLELPISTISPLRIIASLSWINLLGWPAYRRLLEWSKLPEPLVFDFHLHDLWDTPSYRDLPRPWRWLYTHDRNTGLDKLKRFLDVLVARGYRFSTLTRVARELQAGGRPC